MSTRNEIKKALEAAKAERDALKRELARRSRDRSGQGDYLDEKMGLKPPGGGVRVEGDGTILVLGSPAPTEFPSRNSLLETLAYGVD